MFPSHDHYMLNYNIIHFICCQSHVVFIDVQFSAFLPLFIFFFYFVHINHKVFSLCTICDLQSGIVCLFKASLLNGHDSSDWPADLSNVVKCRAEYQRSMDCNYTALFRHHHGAPKAFYRGLSFTNSCTNGRLLPCEALPGPPGVQCLARGHFKSRSRESFAD